MHFKVIVVHYLIFKMSVSVTTNNSLGKDFVAVFPPELSNVLFSYLSDSDLLSASQCCILWRNTINNDQQWAKRCLQKGWTTELTLNEPHHWKDLSHVGISNRARSKPTPAFNLNHYLTSVPNDNNRLNPLCDWAIYYRQRLLTLKNWEKGNYVIHELVAPEAKTETVIINDSAYNGKYLVIGTTIGYVFIWNVAGVPRIVAKVKPILSNKEVRKVAITSKGRLRLVVIYEGLIIHVYEENCGSGKDETTFQLKALGKVFLKMCDTQTSTLQVEFWASGISEGVLDIEKCLKLFATGTENEIPLVEDILFSLSGETILIAWEGESSYILWDLKDTKMNYQIQRLPVLHKITQILLDADLLIFAIEKEEPTGTYYEVMLCKVEYNNSMKITLTLKLAVPSFIDEMVCDRSTNERRLAICCQNGIVGAFCITSKRLLFLNETGSAVNNLAVCKELILYQESTDYNIVALSWLGIVIYKITGHIGPIRGIRCINQFIVSGAAARELMIWDKTSGEIAHRVYHQPSHIVNLYVSSTCILTVGKDDPPVLIGYL